MSHSYRTYQLIERKRIVAGMRGPFAPKEALRVTEALLKEGVSIFEFMMNSEQPIEAMQAVKKAYGDDCTVGMGTVLDTQTAQHVLDSGAEFVVSPAFHPEIVRKVLAADVLIAPGVITPTEAITAWQMGVPLLKLFPIGALGIDYFKAMFGPFDNMKFMCNGAMNLENAQAFIKAGAVAVGMGNWLCGDGTTPAPLIQSRAKQLVEALAEAHASR